MKWLHDQIPMDKANLWQETIHPETGKSSIETHILKVVAVWCKPEDHYFELNISNPRQYKCNKCGDEQDYVLGYHILLNGKVTTADCK